MDLPLIIEVNGPVSVPVVNKLGVQIGTESVDPAAFARDGEINRQLLHDVVLMYLANQRAGTAKGPKPRDYEYHLPKKAVKAATRMAILSKFADGEAVIVDDFGLNGVKTKTVSNVLKAIQIGTKTTEAGQERPKTLLDTT